MNRIIWILTWGIPFLCWASWFVTWGMWFVSWASSFMPGGLPVVIRAFGFVT
jgi:hypothetical protein